MKLFPLSAALGKLCFLTIAVIMQSRRDSLSHKTLGHNAELLSSVLDQVAILGHHHVVEFLPFLGNHHVGVTLHSKFKTYEKVKCESESRGFAHKTHFFG